MTAPACGSCTAPVSDAYLCAGCTRDLAEQLLLAASIAGDLDDAIAKLLKRGTGGPRSEAEAPLPIDLAASEIADRLRLTLRGWVHATGQRVPSYYGPAHNLACAHQSCIRIRLGSGPADRIDALARHLLGRLDALRQFEHAGPYLRDLQRSVAAAMAVVDRQPERAPAGTCDSCGRQLLAELGADEVTCGCGALTVALMAKRRERADAADVLGTAGEISGALERIGIHVPRGTITSWATRKKLLPRPGGMYALSDVLALHAQNGAKRGR